MSTYGALGYNSSHAVDHGSTHGIVRRQAKTIGKIAESDAAAEHDADNPSAFCGDHVRFWNVFQFFGLLLVLLL